MRQDGVTLIELILVVVVLAILAGMAYPSYMRMQERAIDGEAQACLRLISSAQMAYRFENAGLFYRTGGDNNLITINSRLSLQLSDRNFAYSITGANPGFTAIAVRDARGFNRTWQITDTDAEATCLGPNCP